MTVDQPEVNARGERFIDIPGFQGDYQVSNRGRVRSRKQLNRWRFIRYDFVKPSKYRPRGHYRVKLQDPFDNTAAMVRVDLLVAEAFVDNPANLTEVHHRDGDTLNNSAANLQWIHEERLRDYQRIERDKLELR